jgi:transposase-like protein
MGRKRTAADRAGRPAMRSPGRPPVGRLEHRQRFWVAIARGLSSEDAAVEAGVSPAVGVRWFREGGGMPSVALAPASGRYLSFAEREEIAILRARGAGVREIARQLGRSPSTVSREIRRNAATRGGGFEYRATTAQWHADQRARRPKPAKLAVSLALRRYMQDRLSAAFLLASCGPAVIEAADAHSTSPPACRRVRDRALEVLTATGAMTWTLKLKKRLRRLRPRHRLGRAGAGPLLEGSFRVSCRRSRAARSPG